jgi:hypothetical protein
VHSPDGQQIAVAWNRPPRRGLWLIGSEEARETLLLDVTDTDAAPLPIGWSVDGAFVYAVDGKRAAYRGISAMYQETITDARILRIPLAGRTAETVLTLPFEEVGNVTVFPDGRTFLCVVYTSRSDVGVVEDFDISIESRMARRVKASVR